MVTLENILIVLALQAQIEVSIAMKLRKLYRLV